VAGTESSHGSSDGSEGHELKKNPRDPEDVGGNLAGQNAYMQLTMEEKMDIFAPVLEIDLRRQKNIHAPARNTNRNLMDVLTYENDDGTLSITPKITISPENGWV